MAKRVLPGSSPGKWHSHHAAQSKKAANDGEPETTGRALWKGALSFGLVQIPVGMYSAEKPNELAFHQLDKHDDAPIGYDRVNKRTGKKVAYEDIVKGYELRKGSYVLVTDDDFKKANVAASQTIDIEDFVDAASIEPAYFERPYHLLPDGKTAKAYSVLRDAMAKKNLVAIALVVIRTRQHLCAVVPRGHLLELDLLRFHHELRPAPARSATLASKATAREVELAEQLIEKMVTKWTPEKYKDSYRDDLLRALREKAKTGVLEPRNVPEKTSANAGTDLLSLLQASVKHGAKNGAKKKAPTTVSKRKVAKKRAA